MNRPKERIIHGIFIRFSEKSLFIKEKEKMTFESVAKRFGIGTASVMRWSKNIVAKKTRNKPATKISTEALLRDIELYPDAYYYDEQKVRMQQKRCLGGYEKIEDNI